MLVIEDEDMRKGLAVMTFCPHCLEPRDTLSKRLAWFPKTGNAK